MMTRLDILILRAAARLVPAGERREWLAEWLTELWYALHEGRRAGVTAFCLGAFRDALWKRRNAPIARYSSLSLRARPSVPEPPEIRCAPVIESPLCCLGALGCLATLALFLSWLSPVSLPSGGRLFLALLPLSVIYSLVLVFTGNALPGEYPRHRNWAGRWSFFLAKVTLLLLVIALSASAVPIAEFRIDAALISTAGAVRWAMMDQRRRCPVCLRMLDNPVRMGNHSRILLEWNGTELLCLRGHGVMHVPERPAIWFSRQRWLSFVP